MSKKDYLNTINELFPTRRDAEEKTKFQNYVIEEVKKHNKVADIETLDKKHNNIVIGDIATAKVLFTAHYDTPATSLLPNLMLPRNPFLCYLYHFGYPFGLAMLSLALAFVLKMLLNLTLEVYLCIYLVIYFGMFFLCTRCFKNKHNKNDNTSGVAAVLSMVSEVDGNVAYVLFDNEEKGLLGSKAFNKKHKDLLENKLVINMDCIGVGNNVLVIANLDAEKEELYQRLKETLTSSPEYNVLYFPKKGSMANSDHKNFKCGIGVVTCMKRKNVFYTSRIHTNKDNIADSRNIEFITNALEEFINKI